MAYEKTSIHALAEKIDLSYHNLNLAGDALTRRLRSRANHPT